MNLIPYFNILSSYHIAVSETIICDWTMTAIVTKPFSSPLIWIYYRDQYIGQLASFPHILRHTNLRTHLSEISAGLPPWSHWKSRCQMYHKGLSPGKQSTRWYAEHRSWSHIVHIDTLSTAHGHTLHFDNIEINNSEANVIQISEVYIILICCKIFIYIFLILIVLLPQYIGTLNN